MESAARVHALLACALLAGCAPVRQDIGSDAGGAPPPLADGGGMLPGTADGGAPDAGGFDPLVTPPQPPQAVSVRVERGAAVVSWEPPLQDGGAPVTGYTVRVFCTGGTCPPMPLPAGPEARTLRVEGLVATSFTNRFRFEVLAHNRAGASPPLSTLGIPVPPVVRIGVVGATPLPGGTCLRLDLQLLYPEPLQVTLEADVVDPTAGSFRPATLSPAGSAPAELLATPEARPAPRLWEHGADLPGYRGPATLRLRARVGSELYGEATWRLDVGVETRVLLRALELPTGADPWAVRTGDFDGDGRVDIAVANRSTENVAVLFKTPGGPLGERARFVPLGTPAEVLWAGDLDADGDLDLVAGGSRSSELRVLLGQADGDFAAPVRVAAGGWVHVLEGADVDGDGRVDLVSLDTTRGVASLVRGRGDGTFEPPLAVATHEQARWMRLADFDGDGAADLVLAHTTFFDGTVSFHRGGGNGRFLAPVHLLRCPLQGVGAGDVEGDGHVDLLTLCHPVSFDRPKLEALTLEPGGEARTRVLVEALDRPYQHVDVADLGADGRPDLLLRTYESGSFGGGVLSVWTSAPEGGYVQASFWGGRSSLSLALGDLDEDGDLDAVAAGMTYYETPGGLDVLAGAGDGTLAWCRETTCSTSLAAYPFAVLPVDVDADGQKDLLVADRVLDFRLGHGDGSFSPAQALPAPAHVRILAAADFDRDGREDAVAATAEGDVWLLKVGAEGGLLAPELLGQLPPSWRLRLADFNGDGLPDVATSPSGGGSPVLLLSDAEQGYHSVLPRPDWEPGLWTLDVADVNGDGHADLVAGAASLPIRLLLGRGDGTFVDGPDTGAYGRVAAAADLDGDGRADVLTEACQRLPGTAQGLGSAVLLEGPRECVRALPAALDEDPGVDLCIEELGYGSPAPVRCWRNTGAGTRFEFLDPRLAFFGVSALAAADVNGDAVDDVVVAHNVGWQRKGLSVALSGACVECSGEALPRPADACFP